MKTQRRTIVIYTQDGRAYAGATSLDVVRRMIEAGVFTQGKLPEDYMRAVSRRALALDGHEVRHDTPMNFLLDLHRTNTIEIGEAQ